MFSVSIRRLIGIIGIAVALMVAVAIPAGYLATSYSNETVLASFKANLNAGRLAKYIFVHGDLWPYHRVRLAELIELPDPGSGHSVQQRVYTADERLVLTEGQEPTSPQLTVSAPIVVAGHVVGRIEAVTSLRPMIVETAYLTIISAALGALGLFFLYSFPLRVLDRTLSALSNRESELTAQNVRFEAALDNMSQGLCMFDGQQRLIVCNRQFIEMYRHPPEFMTPGTPLRKFLDDAQFSGQLKPGDIALDMQIASRLAEPGSTWHHTLEVSDGRLIAIANRRMGGGGWVSLHDDVTERRRVDAERRLAEAEAERLRQQERASEMANQAKTAFLATMSHEIRTPMNGVLGLAATLLDSDLGPEERRTVAAIHDSGESLMRILNDILDYSKLEAGRLEFEELAFSPLILVEHLISIIGPRARSKRIVLRNETDAQMPPALIGDAGRIRQVLLNLLSNAVKFTATGEIVVRTRCLKREGDKATIEWSVSDSGMGIPAERLKTLFTDFAQADASIARRYGGSGLGLAISRRIVEQMGGQISVESTHGHGTTFRVVAELPWADSFDLDEQDDRGAVDDLAALIAGLGRPLRVLIAEDNPTNQLVTTKMLRQFDVQTHVAADGLEAVAAAERFPFDIVLMDMHMPEMDGLEATRTIRSRGGAAATLPIVALTANAFAQDIKACNDAGMNDFIAKPVRKDLMVRVMLHALSQRPLTDAPLDVPAPAAAVADLPAAPPEAALIDHDAIDLLAEEIGLDGVRETLAVFLTETVERLARLRALTCADDRTTIRGEAHTLKGAAGSLGWARLSALARDVEKRADTLNEADYRALLGRMDTTFSDARAELPERFRLAA